MDTLEVACGVAQCSPVKGAGKTIQKSSREEADRGHEKVIFFARLVFRTLIQGRY